ncbi:MAG: GNAT family N-acetyltransferase [Acidobacteriota bacterium]|nr:GNAT family N-acetyltransferase [Acidobacteriota bacterium]
MGAAFNIRIAETDDEIDRCFPVMAELRPKQTRSGFVDQIRRQGEDNYRLVFLEDDDGIRAVGGFRISDNLAWGKYLYVDDLVTSERARSKGYGRALLGWLVDHARDAGCDELHLDSGVQRFGAHRFYLREGMDITSHHFTLKLREDRS